MTSFITNTNIAATSKVETVGDWLLTPWRYAFGGKKHVLLLQGEKYVRFTNAFEQEKTLSTAAKCAAFILGAPVALLGLGIKAISLVNQRTRLNYLSWKTPQKLSTKEEIGALQKLIEENGLSLELMKAVVKCG